MLPRNRAVFETALRLFRKCLYLPRAAVRLGLLFQRKAVHLFLYTLAHIWCRVRQFVQPALLLMAPIPRSLISLTIMTLARLHYHMFGFDRTVRVSKGFLAGDIFDHKKTLCILALYKPEDTPLATEAMLKELVAQNFYMCLVVNGRIPSSLRPIILRYAHVLLERANYGLDFGGYQVGFAYARKKGWLPCDILFMNNTELCPVRPTKDFWSRIDLLDADARSATHDTHPFFHGQSYFLLISKKVVAQKVFETFWRRHIPSNNKKSTINNGEVGINRLFHCHKISVKPAYTKEDFESVGADPRTSHNGIFFPHQIFVTA